MANQVPESIVAASAAERRMPSRMRLRATTLIHTLWWVVLLAVIGMNLLAIPANLQLLQRPCVGPPCVSQQLNLFQWRSWLLAGFTPANYAVIALAFTLFIASIYVAVAVVLFRSKPKDPMVVYTSFMLILFGGVSFPEALNVLALENVLWWIPFVLLQYLGILLFSGFFFIFPTGHFVPRWTWVVLVFFAVEQFLILLGSAPFEGKVLPDWLRDASFIVATVIMVAAQIYRYRRVSKPDERRQTKWVVYATATALAVFVSTGILFGTFARPREEGVISVIEAILVGIFICVFPISLGIALLRSRLWDIDLIINRTLVYGIVTAILAGLLAVSSDLTKRFFLAVTGESSELAPILATLIVVAAFEPVKSRVQDFTDQHFKYATGSFGAFGTDLRKFVEMSKPEALLYKFLNESLATFGAQSGAVYLGEGQQLRLITQQGAWDGHGDLVVPMEDDGRRVGQIALGARQNGVAYSPEDIKSLKEMCDLVAYSIHHHEDPSNP
jgi:hypothetical protein